MKIFTRTLFLAVALMAFHVSMNGQVDNTFRFVDKTGNEIPDGGTHSVVAELIDKIPGAPGMLVELEAPFDISVENTSAQDAYVSLHVITEEKSSGRLVFCFPTLCNENTPVDFITDNGPIAAGKSQAISAEWLPEEGKYGTAKFTIQLRLMALNPLLGTYSFVANGPKITVDCTYSEQAGISDATMTDTKTETSRYSLDGRKLTSPARGINIVRMADGTVRKVLAK